ncbi:hypothetical protein TorRG33x02_240680 [Trema orientale]|uniref:Uncharacterized protein n=1 Tax=Trema orientale TaxID=63057 RepID=A0A2P5DUX8_TREOI|nr:hypothetical protein TorRG33x02_240680 [Trema orientale]
MKLAGVVLMPHAAKKSSNCRMKSLSCDHNTNSATITGFVVILAANLFFCRIVRESQIATRITSSMNFASTVGGILEAAHIVCPQSHHSTLVSPSLGLYKILLSGTRIRTTQGVQLLRLKTTLLIMWLLLPLCLMRITTTQPSPLLQQVWTILTTRLLLTFLRIVAAPLISDKDHHHTAAVVPPASSNYINHVDTFHISLDDHCHTATIASPGSMVTATAAATLGILEDDHHMAAVALPCPKDDCHNIALAPPSEDDHHYKIYLSII